MNHRMGSGPGLVVLGLIILGGCAGRSDVSREVSDERELTSVGHSEGRFDIAVYHQEEAYLARLSAAPDDVFRALLAIYPGLGIPALTVDTDARLVGNREFSVRRRLADERLAIFFDCGRDLTGPYANQWELTLDMVSSAEPAQIESEVPGGAPEQGALLRTRVRAVGTPNERGLRSIRCTSTGALERRIARLVAAQLEQL